MPSIIRRFRAITRLRDRLNLETPPARGEQLYLVDAVVPTVDLNPVLEEIKSAVSSKDISAGAGGAVTYFTVPANKRWLVTNLYRAATTANSKVYCRPAGETHWLSALSTGETALTPNVHLGPNDTIGMYTTGNGADSSIAASIAYLESDWNKEA